MSGRLTKAVELRRATRGDLAAIAKIQASSRGASAWEPESYLDYDCSVVSLGDRVAGFIVSRDVAPNGREILNLAVDPANRRQGIGRALVEHELARGPRIGQGTCSKGTCSKGTWFLEVRESNVAAISLYTAMGFTAAGCRPDYYRDPAEAAIVMRFFS